eukprot:8394147-Pyramimonas_sp.AAC.1
MMVADNWWQQSSWLCHLFDDGDGSGAPEQCGDRPRGDLGIHNDLTARSVAARLWDLGGPRRPRRHPRTISSKLVW